MINFKNFLFESLKKDMYREGYFLCTKNFRNIRTKMVGKIINHTGKRKYVNYMMIYEFENEYYITLKENGVDVETNNFWLTENQIKSLIKLQKKDVDDYNKGVRLFFKSSDEFFKVIKYVTGWYSSSIEKLNTPYIFYEYSYFDVVDENTISCLSYINDLNVPEKEKYTSELRENITVKKFFDIMYNNKTLNVDGYLYSYKMSYLNYKRIQEGFDVPFYCTPSLSSLFQKIKFKIKYRTYNISYFDITDDDGTISFLPKNKIANIPRSEQYNNKSRQTSKIGRILKRLNDDYNEAEIENFVTIYKTEYNILYKFNIKDVKLVTGDDITFWYNVNNYSKGNGTLNSSCMRHDNNETINKIKFYSKFPDKIALCILVDDKNKLLARSLIWKLDEPTGLIYMDRIYGVTLHHELILKRYADVNNIKAKLDGINFKMKIELKDAKSKHKYNFPYFDTFKSLNYEGDDLILTNYN